MKKKNRLIAIVLIASLIFYLCLCYFLEFNFLEDPFFIIISIIWWALIGLTCYSIYSGENRRKARIRTAFLGKEYLFNPEAGVVDITEKDQIDALQQVLANLTYTTELEGIPHPSTAPIAYVVHSAVFKQHDDGEPEWKGDVFVLDDPDKKSLKFSNKAELENIIKY